MRCSKTSMLAGCILSRLIPCDSILWNAAIACLTKLLWTVVIIDLLHKAFSHFRNAVVRHQLHPDWPSHYFASEMRKSWTEFNFLSQRNFFAENWRNFSAHEQTVFREKYFAFRKDFSQWKSGFREAQQDTTNSRKFSQLCLSLTW